MLCIEQELRQQKLHRQVTRKPKEKGPDLWSRFKTRVLNLPWGLTALSAEATDALPQRKAHEHMHTPKPRGLRFPEAEPSLPQRARAQGQGPTITMTPIWGDEAGRARPLPQSGTWTCHWAWPRLPKLNSTCPESGRAFPGPGALAGGRWGAAAGSELTLPLKGWLWVGKRRGPGRGRRASPGER